MRIAHCIDNESECERNYRVLAQIIFIASVFDRSATLVKISREIGDVRVLLLDDCRPDARYLQRSDLPYQTK
jgi:hypothetical protein